MTVATISASAPQSALQAQTRTNDALSNLGLIVGLFLAADARVKLVYIMNDTKRHCYPTFPFFGFAASNRVNPQRPC